MASEQTWPLPKFLSASQDGVGWFLYAPMRDVQWVIRRLVEDESARTGDE